MRITSYGQSEVGNVRKNNEDCSLCDEMLGLFVVCDGVGGHAGGEIASREAVTTVADYVRSKRDVLAGVEDTPVGRDVLKKLVTESVQAAGKRVYDLARGESGRDRMGTTLTMLLVGGGKAAMGHVGDSRLYVSRAQEIHQLSEDHTYLNMLIRRGELKPEDAGNHRFSNVIMRVLGHTEVVEVDTLVFDVLPGDTYLLCSDGLSGYFPNDGELSGPLTHKYLDGATGQLIQVALERGGKDNVTAVVVRVGAEAEEDVELRTDEVTLQYDTLSAVSLFRFLSHAELLRVQFLAEHKDLSASETVFEEGDVSDSLYIILEGRLEVSRGGTFVTHLSGGSHFGEMALLNARPRSATIRAVDPSRVLIISRDRFNELVRAEPTLGVKLLWSFAQVLSLRLDETTLQLQGAAGPTLPGVQPPFDAPR